MIRRRSLPGERIELYGTVGLIPTDSFTGVEPIGRINAFLDTLDDGGNWRQTDVEDVRTPGGVIAYPGLGRSDQAAVPQPRRYRVRLEAEFYQPHYRLTQPGGTFEGIEFEIFPHNHSTPPANYPKKPDEFPDYLKKVLRRVWLTPATNYPFPNHIPVLRGVVLDKTTKDPVVGAEVAWGVKEKVLTTGPPENNPASKRKVLTQVKGVFALPLRITDKKQATEEQIIDAVDHKTWRTGEIKIKIPDDLGKNHIIEIFKT